MPSISPAPFRTEPRARPGLRRFLGLAQYAGQAFELVWQTDPRLTLGLVGLTIGSGGLPVGIAYFGKLIIDGVTRVVASHTPGQRQHVLFLLGVELALVASLVAMQRALAVCDAMLRVRLAQRVVELVLGKSLDLELADFEDATLYDRLKQVRDQATERPLSLVRRGLQALQLAVGLLGFLLLLAAFSPWIMALLLLTALPAVFVEARFNADAFRLFRSRSSAARLQTYLESLLTSEEYAKEVRAFGLGPELLARHRRIFRDWYDKDRALTLRRGAWGLALTLLASLALAGSYAWVVLQAMAGALSIGALAMLFAVLRQAQNSATELLLVIAGMYDDHLYIGMLREFLAHPTVAPRGPTSGPSPGDGLRFEAVEFKYPGAATPALSELDLHLSPGTKLAVVGRNGAGKSTFVKLALGLYTPTRGRVLLDGLDLREWNREALSSRFGVLFQDFVRFQLQAADNIGFGDVAHASNEAALSEAARHALVHDLLQSLPRRYQTQLGHSFEAGHELSVGEWQKLAFARVFMRRSADILVLDEPSSSLDAQAEQAILGEFLRFCAGRSAILISHRLATLRAADEILVLDLGRCVARGKHDELVARTSVYAELFATQAAGYR